MFRAYYGLYIKYPIGLSGKTITRQPACSLNILTVFVLMEMKEKLFI